MGKVITRKGHEFSYILAPMFWPLDWDAWQAVEQTCSLIVRHAVTHKRLAEESCNGHPLQGAYPPVLIERMNKLQEEWDARIEKRTAQIEKRITDLIDSLPMTPTGKLGAYFGGDPRGCTVQISLPPGQEKHSNSWSGNYICVPQE